LSDDGGRSSSSESSRKDSGPALEGERGAHLNKGGAWGREGVVERGRDIRWFTRNRKKPESAVNEGKNVLKYARGKDKTVQDLLNRKFHPVEGLVGIEGSALTKNSNTIKGNEC